MNAAATLATQPGLPSDADEKLAPLEFLRGVAALGVFAIHLLIGFAPAQSGYLAETAPTAAIGGILFAPYDGPALLAFFFLLSGFVLSRSVMRARGTQAVVRGLIKRWPRLALLCLISTVLSWALLRAGLYFNGQAAEITGSAWLAHHVVPGTENDAAATLWRAIRQGAYAVFSAGEVWFNTSLWTMRIELLGSMVPIGLAPLTAYAWLAEAGRVFAIHSAQLWADPARASTRLAALGAEKQRAFAQGAMKAGMAAMRGANPDTVARAAMAPARRRVRANARKIQKG